MENPESRIAPSPEGSSEDPLPTDIGPAGAHAYWRGVADGLARAGEPVPSQIAVRAQAPSQDADPPERPPWHEEPFDEAGRQRRDAFTQARKRKFLDHLSKCGCLLEACRKIGVSHQTVYNHQEQDAEFARHCELATEMGRAPAPLYAWERAVRGVPEEVIHYGKVVGTRLRRSDMLLRMFCQAADPKRFGPRPGFTRKRLLRHERKRIELEVRAELAESGSTFEEAIHELDKSLDAFGVRQDRKRRDSGWTELGCGIWIPPGWVWQGEGDPRDAVRTARDDDVSV